MKTNSPLKIGIVAGEASGDLLGANLIKKIREKHPDSIISGLGGPLMKAAGFHSIANMERLSVMGLIEPLFHLRDLFKLRHELYTHFLENRPDVFVGIDSPDFNLGLEIKLRKESIPVVHYVSPSVWAWRQNRIKKIAKAVDLMMTLFPFEADFYQKHQVPVSFVGHPMADIIPLKPNKINARNELGLDLNKPCIALLPGSRRNELKYHADVFITTAELLLKANPNLQLITSSVNKERDLEFKAAKNRVAPQLPLSFFIGESHKVMEASDVVLVTSGTATLETMLFKRPMVIVYKMNSLTYKIAKRLVRLKHIGLPNLLANKKLVPEFIQDSGNPEVFAKTILEYLNESSLITELEQQFLSIHEHLRCNASQNAADNVLKLATN